MPGDLTCVDARPNSFGLTRLRIERVHELRRAEAHRIVRRQAGLGFRLLDRATGSGLVEVPRVERDREHARRPGEQADPLVQVDELG